MGAESKVWNQDADHVVATCGSLVVTLWRGQGTYKNWRIESTPVFRYMQSMSPKGCLVLVVAEEKAVGPDAQARMEVDMLARERANQVKGSAILAYGPAMRLASIRALVTAINIFSKTGIRVFTDHGAAMAALAESAQKAAVELDIPAATQLVNSIRTVK